MKSKIGVVLVCLWGIVGYLEAKTLYVDVNSTNSVFPYSSWETASSNIQAAVDVANTEDEIWVAQGIYHPRKQIPGTTGERYRSFQLKNGITIYGGFDGTEALAEQRNVRASASILSGDIGVAGDISDNSLHIVYNTGIGSATLDGFILTGGNANGSGEYRHGGAAYNDGFSLCLANCAVVSNSATAWGGGVYNYQVPNACVTSCTFSANTCYSGAGIFNNQSSCLAYNSTFCYNVSGFGGGIGNRESSSLGLYSCTIAENNSSSTGASIHAQQSSTVTVLNSILWGTTGNKNINLAVGSSASITYSAIYGGYSGVGNISKDPMLQLLADNGGATDTMRVASLSPAIGAGTFNGSPSDDQRGVPRPQNPTMGAFEFSLPDDDGDGLPDEWEQQYFDGATNAVPENDDDNDGMSNADEFLVGTHPLQASSKAYKLNIVEAGSGSVVVDPWISLSATNGWVVAGKNVTLVATAQPGWVFTEWSGVPMADPVNPVGSFSMDTNYAVVSFFEQGTNQLVKVGDHPTASRSYRSELHDLHSWNGRLYMAYGHWNERPGPINVVSYRPSEERFVVEHSAGTDSIGWFRSINNNLYVPSLDPAHFRETTDFSMFNGTNWVDDTTLGFLHLFDLGSLDGSDLWAAGSKSAIEGSSGGASLMRSIDGGNSWSDATPPNSYSRYYWLFELNGKIYVQGQCFDGTVWGASTLNSQFFNKAIKVSDELVVGKAGGTPGMAVSSGPLVVFDGTNTTTLLPSVIDFEVAQGSVYALVEVNGALDVRVCSNISDAYPSWQSLGILGVPADATCVGVLDSVVYIGVATGELYSAALDGTVPDPVVPSVYIEQSDRLGAAMASDGRWLAIGSPHAAGAYPENGNVLLYKDVIGDGSWELHAELSASAGNQISGRFFGQSISMFDNRLAVAETGTSSVGPNRGELSKVYIYELEDQNLDTVQIIESPYVQSVCLKDEWLILGCKDAVDIRRWDGDSFETVKYINLVENGLSSSINWPLVQVELNGSILIVAISGDITFSGGPGEVWIYEVSESGVWLENGRQGIGNAPSGYGRAVSLGRRYMAVGGPRDDYGALQSGAVYINSIEGGEFVEIHPPEPAFGLGFGASVLLDDVNLFIGAPGANGGAGKVYHYLLLGQGWVLQQEVQAEMNGTSGFGSSLTAVGSSVWVGAADSDTLAQPLDRIGHIPMIERSGITYVDAAGTNPVPPFSTWATATRNIQDAVNFSTDSVWIAEGFYYPEVEILVEKEVSIRSVAGPEMTIIDGRGLIRCFNLKSSTCTLDGVTITNGYFALDGGGIYANSLDPILTNCVIVGNVAGNDGGGVVNCTLYDCKVEKNYAGRFGGGTYSSSLFDSSISVNSSGQSAGGMRRGTATRCEISGNVAIKYGGAVQGATLFACMVEGNRTLTFGGGGLQGSSARAYGCVFRDNHAATVGGAGAAGAQFFNCLIYNNSSPNRGGGINDCKAINCTIIGNRSGMGGGVAFGTVLDRTVHNSIIHGNTANSGSYPDIYMYNRTESGTFYSCSPDLEHGVDGNITNAPQLASLSDLAAASPCIGAGDAAVASGTDIDGDAWLNPPSMGCNELHGTNSLEGLLVVSIEESYPVVLAGVPTRISGSIAGSATRSVWSFGDGSFEANNLFPGHIWNSNGIYDVVLTAYNDTYVLGVAATQTVQVVSVGDKVSWSENGHLYQVVAASDGITWDAAQADAAARGGYLATPISEEENAFIYGLVQSTNLWQEKAGPWLGGFQPAGREEPDGGWKWVSGEAWGDEIQINTSFDNFNGTENRIQFWNYSSNWNDNSADNTAPGYVVEYQILAAASGSLSVAVGEADTVVAGYPLGLAGTLDGLATMLVWDFGDGSSVTNNQFPTYEWMLPGNYEVVLTAFNVDHPVGVVATQSFRVVSVETGTAYVAQDGDDVNDGSSWALAKASIQAGVDAAAHGGKVWVSAGTYVVTNTILVGRDINIESVSGPFETAVDGSGLSRCFHFGAANAMLSGFTATNGIASDYGGGVLCEYLSAVVSNCVVVGNSALKSGGGVAGGTLCGCLLTGNEATKNGGGISKSILFDCQVFGNLALLDGGGASGSRGITHSRIYGNQALRNGGGANVSSLFNCAVFGNTADNRGGGTRNCNLYNSTLVGNSADQGGGLWQDKVPDNGDVFNCIIYGNMATSSGIDIGRAEDTVKVVLNSCSSDVVHGTDGNITNAPSFVNEVNSDYSPTADSPCINWGDNTFVTNSIDLDSNPRVVEGYVDMGCYEYQGIINNPDSDGDGIDDMWEWSRFSGNAAAVRDEDGDKSDNLSEFIAGTDPWDPTSVFAITNWNMASEIVLDWNAVTGRSYQVYWTSSLTNDFQPLDPVLFHPLHSFTDTVYGAEDTGFYKVKVQVR